MKTSHRLLRMLMRTGSILLFLGAFTNGEINTKNQILDRQKRTLLYNPGVQLAQLIIGIGIPVDLEKENVIVGILLKLFYELPTNTSQLHSPIIYERKKRSLSRWDIYQILTQESESRGLGGKSCILRSICEVAESPMDKSNGFFEEVFHTIFTPTSTKEKISHHGDNEYYAAQKIGRRSKGQCKQLFPECKETMLNMFTNSDYMS